MTGTYAYDTFGAVRAQSGVTTEWSHTGEQNDPTGLEYLRARYYDASTGRFLSQDPVPLLQRYAYANDNPANLVDPSGLYTAKDAQDALVARFEQLMAAERAIQAVAKQILADPCWKTHAFCKHVAFVWKTTGDVSRFIQNAPFTAGAAAWGTAMGGSCSMDADLFVVCAGMRWGYGRGGTTVGNVFMTGKSRRDLDENPDLPSHEKRHATQWQVFGPALPGLYFSNEAIGSLLSGPTPCWNVFEWDAGLKSGEYPCRGFGRGE